MVFSGPVNYRHLLSATCASAITLGVVAAPAEAAVDPIGRECKAATAAAKLGQPIPNIGNFVFGPNENVIDGNLVRIYAPDKYKPHITKATDQWTSATGGLIRFEYVNQPGYKVVTVREANLGGYVVGRVQGTVENMQLLLNPDILRNGYTDSLVMTITHELGHAMGLAHSCDGALMKDGSNRGKVATTLQPLDVQVLIQANNLRQYGGRPATTTTTAPAPVTTTAAPEPQTLEKAQAALADANSALTAAQRNLDAAQAKYDAIPAWQILSKTAAEQDVNAAQGRVARAQSAVQSAEALVEKFSPTPAPEAPTASPTTAVQTAAPATTSEPSIVYVTETVPAPEPTVEPTSEMPKPVTSTVVEEGPTLELTSEAPQPETSTVVVEDEPTPETTSSEAEPTTSDTQVALPKPTSLREAQQAFEVAQAEYVAAFDTLQVARVTGIGLAKAQEEIANALAAYGQASENRREYIAAHPDEVLETTSNQQPSAPSEPSPTTTSAPSSEEPAPSSTVPTSAPSPVGAATSTQQPSQAPSTTTTQKTTSTSVSTPAQSSTKQPTSSEAAATSAPSTVQAVTPAQETTSTVTTTRTAAQQSTATRATTPAVSTSSTTTKRVSMAPSSTTQKTTAISVSTPAQSSSSTPASSETAATSALSTVQAATPAPQATPTATRATKLAVSTSSTMPSSSEISTSATTSANSLTSSTSASTTKPQESEAAGTTVASISEEHTSTSKPGYVIEITGEHRATTIQVGPTRAPISATTSREPATTAKQAPAATTKVTTSTEPAAATQPQSSTSAPAISRETSTVNVDITVTNGDQRDVKEGDAVTNGGSPVAAIIIPVVALLLAALGATGWAHMNGLF